MKFPGIFWFDTPAQDCTLQKPLFDVKQRPKKVMLPTFPALQLGQDVDVLLAGLSSSSSLSHSTYGGQVEVLLAGVSNSSSLSHN